MIKRVRYHFAGIVQGVGFRPFIYRMARQHTLAGFVQNRPDGVVVEVEGPGPSIDAFISDVNAHLPPLADVIHLSVNEATIRKDSEFKIIASDTDGEANVHITPDIATCGECLGELFDPKDRRYHYPFINCTNCGPRLTIIGAIPYDRVNTSMACFPMCPECLNEYRDPADRRFHAEPNACPVCGPRLTLLDEDGQQLPTTDPLQTACDKLFSGGIIAIKGLGGFHLCVDACNDAAIKRLRSRKYREAKPLAIMVKNIKYACQIARVNDVEKVLLESFQRPVVLLKKKNLLVSEGVAPGMGNLGIMLPYTPIQHLLFEKGFPALVMTSANQTDEPICIGNREAITRLKGIADFFLVHNRDILVRCDDSIAMVAADKPILMRRSRGYVSKPLMLRETYPDILALGPQSKTTICILKDNLAFLSPHIGDLETPQARDFLHESTNLMSQIAQCRPKRVACDLHPGYYTTRAALNMEDMEEVIPVQHHHAHVVSCMAENGITGQVIGLAMDGTGYGSDGHIWGGEFLVADEADFTRFGHLSYYLLPGGEKAIHEPWRIATSLLRNTFGDDDWHDYAQQLDVVPEERYYPLMEKIMRNRINSPFTSSLGRLFDGVAVILGLRQKVSFEGQTAMEMEAIATKQEMDSLPFDITAGGNCFLLDFSPAIRKITESLLAGQSKGSLAWAFHYCLQKALCEMAIRIRKQTGLNRTVLTGGCFQNRILLEGCLQELEDAGFDVFIHRRVPTNDGGISLGQAVCASARVKTGLSSPGKPAH
ncbi:MAG: carbamoyltransferase HypF [Syntrophales bacterium]|nr:carbamoyltransferase HypF [Syntrophales bacterium]